MVYLVLKFLFMEDGTIKKSVYDFSGEDSLKKALCSFHSNCDLSINTANVKKVTLALIDDGLNIHRTESWEKDSDEVTYVETV